MNDLATGIVIVLALTVIIGLWIYRISEAWSRDRKLLTSCLALVCIYFHYQHLAERLFWTNIFPFKNAIILSNLVPVYSAVIIALSLRLLKGSAKRKFLFLLPLCLASIYPFFHPFLNLYVPKRPNKIINGLHFQTTLVSCSAAAAATLLGLHEIESNEQEMSRLCLTSRSGTLQLGLYRGLKIKAEPYGFKIQTGYPSQEELLDIIRTTPAIISVGLPASGANDPRYETDWGWEPEVRHSVVALTVTDDNRILVGDPSTGIEYWDLKALKTLRLGPTLYLTRESETEILR